VHIPDKCIGSFDPTTFDKWRRYFQLKHRFYLAYAYAYLGESLLAEDKCGMAVRACKEGIASYELAEDFCAKYAKATGPGKSVILRILLQWRKKKNKKKSTPQAKIFGGFSLPLVPLLRWKFLCVIFSWIRFWGLNLCFKLFNLIFFYWNFRIYCKARETLILP
jgi:hypothetical protein